MSEPSVGEPIDGDETDDVDRLGPDSTGRWLIITRASLYVWDADEGWAIRVPLLDTVHLTTDTHRVQLTQVDAWPTVGHAMDAWWQDPRDLAFEYRLVSSLVVSITRLRLDDREDRQGVGSVLDPPFPDPDREPGQLDLRVFDQARWWVDEKGTVHLLDEMPVDYLANLVTYFRENAAPFHIDYTRWRWTEAATDILVGRSAAPLTELQALGRQDPATWVEGTALVLRLRQLIGGT